MRPHNLALVTTVIRLESKLSFSLLSKSVANRSWVGTVNPRDSAGQTLKPKRSVNAVSHSPLYCCMAQLLWPLAWKYGTESIATTMGHLDQERANQRSTKPYLPRIGLSGSWPAKIGLLPCSDIKGKVNSDRIGQFFVPSSRGNVYILVVYDMDWNFIFAEPIRSCTKEQIFNAYKQVHELLSARGLQPQFSVTDNEASKILKDYLITQGILSTSTTACPSG